MNALETALYNVITAASPGITVYNGVGHSAPYAVFDYVSSDTDDTGNTKSDVLLYDVKAVGDSDGGQLGSQTTACYAGRLLAALTGPAAVNVTGSLSGYTCTDCSRLGYIKYLDGGGFWHVGWKFRFRITA